MWATVALTLVGEPRFVDDATLPLDGARATLQDGLAFEITDGKGGPRVGWAFVGDGAFATAVPDGGDALALAANLELPEVYLTRHMDEPIDMLLVLADDPAMLEPIDEWPVVRKDRGSLVWTDDDGLQHVLVSDLRPNAAATKARAALNHRVERLTHTGLDPRIMLAQERLRAGVPRAVVEARTERSWVPMIEPAYNTGTDRWLTWLRDPTGGVDDTYRSVVAVQGVGAGDSMRWRVLTGVTHPAEPERALFTKGLANTVIETVGVGREVSVQTVALLTVQTPHATELINLAVPRPSPHFRAGLLPVPAKFEIEELTVDGIPLERVGVPWGPFAHDDRVDLSTWRLPQSLEPGVSVELRLRWSQRWRASNYLDLNEASHVADKGNDRFPWMEAARRKGQASGFTELGRVTSGNGLMPQIPGVRHSYPTEIRIGTAATHRWLAAIGSGNLEEIGGDRGRWVTTQVPSTARISFGDFDESFTPSIADFPSIRILRHSQLDGGSPQFVRAVVNFYQRVLAPYPFEEVTVVEGAYQPVLTVGAVDAEGQLQRPSVRAYPGHAVLVGLRSFLVGRGATAQIASQHPKAFERGLAHALALDWWRDRSWTARNAWIPGALAAMYRDRFVHHAYGSKVTDAWRASDDRVLAKLPDDMLMPIAGARDPWTAEMGARLIGDALRHRMGEPKLLEAMDRYHRSGASTMDALQSQLEAVGGESLEDFFDTWIVAGIRPMVEGRWRRTEDGVTVDVTSDVTAAPVTLPVRVTCRKSTRTHWVTVSDGQGTFALSCEGAAVEVQVDPDGWLPLRGRTVTEVKARRSARF